MASSLNLPANSSVTCSHCGEVVAVSPGEGSVVCPRCDQRLERGSPDFSSRGETLEAGVEGGSSDPRNESVLASDDQRMGEISVPSSIKAPDFTAWGVDESQAGMTTEPAEEVVDPHKANEAEVSPLISSDLSGGSERAADVVGAREGEQRPFPAPHGSPASVTRGVSRRAFWALLIYASVVTAVCLGLLLLALTNRAHQLESLPDVVPPTDAQGEIARQLVPVDAKLPPGHVLELGQTQRFGDLLVTPLKVTREQLDFVHFQGTQVREPEGEVLKLWLKFENVSSNERAFAPLDGELLFYRAGQPGSGSFKANNFLARSKTRSQDELTAMFDHPLGSDWDLAEQNLGQVIPAGESLVSYVPTETGLPELDGPLVWRFQLRKGIADNGWGVTTLVEVAFSASEIQGS